MRTWESRPVLALLLLVVVFVPNTATADVLSRVERALSIMEKFQSTACVAGEQLKVVAKGGLNVSGLKDILLEGFEAGVEGEVLKQRIVGAIGFDSDALRLQENKRIATCVERWVDLMISEPPSGPVVLMLDSRLPGVAYDMIAARERGETNTDKIEDLLIGKIGSPDPTYMQIGTTVDWDRVYLVERLNPNIVTLHWSAFEDKGVSCNIWEPDDRCADHFIGVLADMAALTIAEFLVYSRTEDLCGSFREALRKRLTEAGAEDVGSRILLFDMNLRGKSFDSGEAKRDLRNVIRYLLERKSGLDLNHDKGVCFVGQTSGKAMK